MTGFTCRGCGKPNGVTESPVGIAAMIATMIRCDACEAEATAQEAAQRVEWNAEQQRQRVLTLPRALQEVKASESPAPKLAIDAAWTWAKDGGGLMLTGPIGTGKTYLAAAATRFMMGTRAVTWQSVPSMLINSTAAFTDTERAKAMKAITGTGPLVLDDLDKVKPSEWAAAQLFAAIDNRATAGAPLLITANLTPGGIADKFGGEIGPAIASRLVGYCDVVECAGEDARLRGAA